MRKILKYCKSVSYLRGGVISLLLLVGLEGCKKNNDLIPNESKNLNAIENAKSYFQNLPKNNARRTNPKLRASEAESDEFYKFDPNWDNTVVYALRNGENIVVSPVVRNIGVYYGEQGFLRKLVTRLDANARPITAYIVEILADKDYLKEQSTKIFEKLGNNDMQDFRGVVLIYTPNYEYLEGYRFENGKFKKGVALEKIRSKSQNRGSVKGYTITEECETPPVHPTTPNGSPAPTIPYPYVSGSTGWLPTFPIIPPSNPSPTNPTIPNYFPSTYDSPIGPPPEQAEVPENGETPKPTPTQESQAQMERCAPAGEIPVIVIDTDAPTDTGDNTEVKSQTIKKEFKKTCFNDALEVIIKAKPNNELIKTMLDPFEGNDDKSFDLTFKDTTVITTGSIILGYTKVKTYDLPDDTLYLGATIFLNDNALVNASQELVVSVLLHEITHAYLQKENLNFTNSDEHIRMMGVYIDKFHNTMKSLFPNADSQELLHLVLNQFETLKNDIITGQELVKKMYEKYNVNENDAQITMGKYIKGEKGTNTCK